jgi:hypothetical protein
MISKTAYTHTVTPTIDNYDVRAGSMLKDPKTGTIKKVSAVDTETGQALCQRRGRPSADGPVYDSIDLSQYKTLNETIWEVV